MTKTLRIDVPIPPEANVTVVQLDDVFGMGPGVRIEGPRESVIDLVETILRGAEEASE